MQVSMEEFVGRLDDLTGRAEVEPLTITREGRGSLVLVSAEEYLRLHGRHAASGSISEKPRKDLLALRGSMRGLVQWDGDEDITAPTGEVWKAEL